MIGASVPPLLVVYAIGESVDTAVMKGVGSGVPKVQEMFRVVPSDTLRRGALLLSCSVIGMERSAKPETLTVTDAVYVPGARVSQTVVELNRRLFGAVPFVESTVSQMGRLAVFKEKNGAGF